MRVGYIKEDGTVVSAVVSAVSVETTTLEEKFARMKDEDFPSQFHTHCTRSFDVSYSEDYSCIEEYIDAARVGGNAAYIYRGEKHWECVNDASMMRQ